MDILKKISQPPWLALVLGVPAMVCMAVLRQTGLDENMLFDHSNLAILPLWLLTAAMALLAVLAVRPLGGKLRYTRLFPQSTEGAIGIAAGAAAVLWGGWSQLSGAVSGLDTAVGVMGLGAALVLGYLAWCRFRGIPHSFLLWGLVTVYLLLRLMVTYRGWSAQTDLLHFFFPMVASVTVSVAFYHRTAFGLGMGSRRMYLGCTQICAFCCLVSLGMGFDLFYAGMLLWSVLDVCSTRPVRERRQKTGEDPA